MIGRAGGVQAAGACRGYIVHLLNGDICEVDKTISQVRFVHRVYSSRETRKPLAIPASAMALYAEPSYMRET